MLGIDTEFTVDVGLCAIGSTFDKDRNTNQGSPLVSVTIPSTWDVCAITLITGKSKSINNKLVIFDFIMIDWLVWLIEGYICLLVFMDRRGRRGWEECCPAYAGDSRQRQTIEILIP